MALKQSARSWLMDLPPNSIQSWDDLCDQFMAAFQSGYKHPGVISDLHVVIQREDETLRKYIQRFYQGQHNILEISPHAVITTFHVGVRDLKMQEKLGMRNVHTTTELFALADKCTRAAEARKLPDVGSSSKPGKRKNGKRE